MIWAVIAFWLAALGSKLILAMWIVWVLLPGERECSVCDGETSALEPRYGLRTLARWAGVQSRWCPRCGDSYLARRSHPPLLWVGRRDAESAPGPTAPAQVLERRSQ